MDSITKSLWDSNRKSWGLGVGFEIFPAVYSAQRAIRVSLMIASTMMREDSLSP